MGVQAIADLMMDQQRHQEYVRVSIGVSGGWDVTATIDGRVIWACHCADWHRTERARRRMEHTLGASRHAAAPPEISTT